VAKATSPARQVPTDPVDLLSTPLAHSGLAAGATLRRAGIKLDFYTVRDLLFHLPRRYDDLREMRRLGDLVWERDGTVVSAQARVGDVRVEPGFRGRTQRTIARLEDDTGAIDATWFGRRFIERRLPVGAEIVVSGKVKHFGRRLTLDNPEFQVVAEDTELLHAGRIVPVYPLTAGLTSIRLRAAIREALDKAGYAYPEYLPAPIMATEGLVPIARAIEEDYPRLAGGTQRCAGSRSTSSLRCSSGWSSGVASASATRRHRSPWRSPPTRRSGRRSWTRWACASGSRSS
jgi:ATP-dependent DNA helicase RecG